jgi:carbonic anhydrase
LISTFDHLRQLRAQEQPAAIALSDALITLDRAALDAQVAILARLYLMNARPVQATNGRMIKQSR